MSLSLGDQHLQDGGVCREGGWLSKQQRVELRGSCGSGDWSGEQRCAGREMWPADV